ncbi:MAG: class I SAM-dependent methyltransferase, partial [Burkholderiales bacterium]
MAALDSFLTTTLSPWAERLRVTANLPVLLRWCLDSPSQAPDLSTAPAFKLGDFTEPRVEIRIRDRGALPLLLSPSLDNLGRAYVEGLIDLIGSAQDLVAVAWRLAESGASDLGRRARRGPLAGLLHPFGVGAGRLRPPREGRHTQASDREAIHYHYDVSNEFYAQWLDPAMVYSCAYFENGDETLAEAQIKKIDHILTKLRPANDRFPFVLAIGRLL